MVVLEVAGKKEQKVYTYDTEEQKPVHYVTTIVPSVVVPKITTKTTVNEKEVTISTSVEQIKKIHPESTPAVAVCIKENPNIIIESAVV